MLYQLPNSMILFFFKKKTNACIENIGKDSISNICGKRQMLQ